MTEIAIETILLSIYTGSFLLAIIEFSKSMNRFNEYRRNARFMEFFDAIEDGRISPLGHPFDLNAVYKMTMDRLEKISNDIDLYKLNTIIPLMICTFSSGILGILLDEPIIVFLTFIISIILSLIEIKYGWEGLEKTAELLSTHGRVNPYAYMKKEMESVNE